MSKLAKRETTRLIQGVILKCVDGRWLDAEGQTPPAQLLVLGTIRALQCWQEQKPIDTIIEAPGGEPLPDVDELNAKIPEDEWEAGLDGKPRPPWQLNYVVYLIDPETADTYTFLNSTRGAQIAVERLSDKIKWMRAMRGANVTPIVKLDSRPMKTAFGEKLRPEFTVLEWRELDVAPSIAQNAAPQIEHQPAPASPPAEQSPPTETVDGAGPPQEPKKKKNAAIGKPVRPVTAKEALDDELPF
jgi:hypothetical protein